MGTVEMSPCTQSQDPVLVIVSGVPGTGKTTLGAVFRDRLGWPLLGTDRFKEILFDASGMRPGELDQSTSRKFGDLAEAALYAIAGELLTARCSCIFESFFLPDRSALGLAILVKQSLARQLHCTVPSEISIARYRERFAAGLPIPDTELRPIQLPPFSGSTPSAGTRPHWSPYWLSCTQEHHDSATARFSTDR